MSVTPIPGRFSRIYLSEYGSTMASTLVGCTTSDTWTGNSELVEVTSFLSDYVEYQPTYKSATLTAEALLAVTTSGVLATDTLINWQRGNTLLDFTYEYDNKQITGTCYIASLSIQGSTDEYATVSISLQCTGAWEVT